MRKIFITILLSTIAFYAFAQWNWVNPKPIGYVLNDIHFVNDDIGYVFGNKGTVLKTHDGGQNWSVIPQTIYNKFYKASFCTPDIGYVSSNGTIFKTMNGCATWTQIETGNSDMINDLCFVNEQTGFFVTNKGKLHKTSDGGITWNIKISQQTWGLGSVVFANENVGIATSIGGSFYVTRNGGNNWTKNDVECSHFYAATFTDADHWFITGSDGTLLKTTNAGNSWARIKTNKLIGEIKFIDNLTGYGFASPEYLEIGGKNFYKTTDGGYTWNKLIFDDLYSFHVRNNTNLIFAGSYGRLLSTNDDCFTFKDHNPAVTYDDIIQIQFPSADTGYAISYIRTMIKTVDGGENWQVIPLKDSTSAWIKGFWFTNNYTGYYTSDSSLYKTTDGGNTWNRIFCTGANRLTNVYFITKDKGFLLGDWDGSLYRTLDAGATWDLIFKQNNYFSAIQFLTPDTGFIATRKSFLRTNDGGLNWLETELDQTDQIHNMHVVNSKVAYLCGGVYQSSWPTVFKTIDGGLTWNKQEIKEGYAAVGRCIYFMDEERGFLGTSNSFYQTINGGETWESVKYMQGYFASFWFTSQRTGFVTGSGGMIMKTTNSGTLSIQELEKPQNLFTLYPNPATNEISLKSLTAKGKIAVSIYNSSGSCVFDGSYKSNDILINTDSFKTGIYIVRINTANGTETKKLVIL